MTSKKVNQVITKRVDFLRKKGLEISKEKESLVKEWIRLKPASYVEQMLQFAMSSALKSDVETIAALSVIDEVCTSIFWSELRRIEMEMKSILQISAEADEWREIEFKSFNSSAKAAEYADIYKLDAPTDDARTLVILPTQLIEWENNRNGGEKVSRRTSKKLLIQSLLNKYGGIQKSVAWDDALNEMSLGDLVPLCGLLNNSDYMRVIGGKKSGLKRAEAIKKATILRRTRNHIAHGGSVIVPSAPNAFSPSGYNPSESMAVVDMMTRREFATRLRQSFQDPSKELPHLMFDDVHGKDKGSQKVSMSTKDINEIVEKVMSAFFK